MDSECVICCSPYDKRSHLEIKCSNCNNSACRACHQTFLLSNSAEARCMHCNVAWSIVYLYRNFTNSFVVKFRHQQRDTLWNRELFHLPLLAEYVEHERNEKKYRSKVAKFNRSLVQLKKQRTQLYKDNSDNGKKELDRILSRIDKVSTVRNNCFEWVFYSRNEASNIKRNFVNNNADPVRTETQKATRNHPCAKDDCRGFVNSKGSCPICDEVTCLKCNVLITGNESHSCKPEDVESWKELRKNTRPCPSCHVPIFKISGCDQMWCVQCHTAFNWGTGVIETGSVHNPHYFEQLFNGNVNRNFERGYQDDGMCNEGTIPNASHVRQKLNNESGNGTLILGRLRELVHIHRVTMVELTLNDEQLRRSLFNYLTRHIQGKDNMKKSYEILMTKKQIYDEYLQLFQTYINQQSYLFNSFLNDRISESDLISQYDAFNGISNDTITEFNHVFKRKICFLKT